jgi:NADPH-dependent 2,4-dienoyl-CoA reductase/sulfur reductase-like enzyme
MTCTRRAFGGMAAMLMLTRPARAQGRVVVIGGGVGGATAARWLATMMPAADVTLVEPNQRYVTCFFSNHYLAGLRPFDSIAHDYAALERGGRIRFVHDLAQAIDPVAKTVRLARGATLPYDRAVLATGITLRDRAIEGYDADAMQLMPHAWTDGSQIELLGRQLGAMDDGGVFVIAVPPEPYRCPPAPYERASLVASYFRRHKPRSKILLLDAKDSFTGQDLFEDGWRRHYPGMIEWLPGQFSGTVTAVDGKSLSLVTTGETFRASVANVIPPQMAGPLAQRTGLADRSGWCPVDPITFESVLQPGIHLVGDAILGGDMPKSAVSAHSQAKACAAAIAAALSGTVQPAPPLVNTCYSFLAPDDAWTSAIGFRPVAGTIKATRTVASKVADTGETRRRTAAEAEAWYASFSRDVFG